MGYTVYNTEESLKALTDEFNLDFDDVLNWLESQDAERRTDWRWCFPGILRGQVAHYSRYIK